MKSYTSLDIVTLNFDHKFEMEKTYSILLRSNATFQ
jgi:hypothetical protein